MLGEAKSDAYHWHCTLKVSEIMPLEHIYETPISNITSERIFIYLRSTTVVGEEW